MDTTLVAVSYRKPDLLSDYIDKLNQHHPELETILIDVAPEKHGTYDVDTHISVAKANYSEAVNIGLRRATREYIIWGNEDILVKGPFVDKLLAPVVADKKTITGPGRSKQCGWPFIIGWLVGMHRDALDDIGYLDERYDGTFEDVDWSIRAVIAGYRLQRTPVPVVHMHLGRLNQFLFDGKRKLVDKWGYNDE